MANIIETVTKMIPTIDEVYQKECKTSVLDGKFNTEWDAKCKEFKIAKKEIDGLTTYDKSAGYADADVKVTWESHKPNFDQGARIKVDAIENEQSAGLAMADNLGQFERLNVYPTLDAFRLSTYASKAGTTKEETLDTIAKVLKSLRTASNTIEDLEADPSSCYVFINPSLYNSVRDADTTVSRAVMSEFAGFIKVPQKRLYTGGQFVAKKGFRPTVDSKLINYIIIDKNKVLQDKQRLITKVFTPEQNQNGDDYVMPYRRVEIADILENGQDGVYVSVSTENATV